MFDFSNLARNNQLQYEGGLSIEPRMYGGVEMRYYSMHMAVTDWFDSSGSVFDIDTYVPFEEAYNYWKDLHYRFLSKHLMHAEDAECTCGPEPAKPVYGSNAERKPRLLSDLLASNVKIPQIDSIPVQRLNYLNAPVDFAEENEDIANTEGDQESAFATSEGAERNQVSRKPTDAEIRERRNELVEIFRKRATREKASREGGYQQNGQGEYSWRGEF